MAYLGTQPNDVKQNIGLYTPSDILQLTKDGNWGGSLELIEEQTYSTGVNNIDFTSIKENIYNVHFMTIDNLTTPVESGTDFIRFYESGVLESGSVYQYASQAGDIVGNFNETRSTANTGILLGSTGSSVKKGAYIYFYNLGNSSKYSYCTFHLTNVRSGNDNMRFGGGVLPQASTVDGIRYAYTGSSTISDFTIKLYGIKEI